MKPDQERVKNLLTDTVTLLCKNGLTYIEELRIEGVIAVTVDDSDIFVVHLNEKFIGETAPATDGASETQTAAENSSSVPHTPDKHTIPKLSLRKHNSHSVSGPGTPDPHRHGPGSHTSSHSRHSDQSPAQTPTHPDVKVKIEDDDEDLIIVSSNTKRPSSSQDDGEAMRQGYSNEDFSSDSFYDSNETPTKRRRTMGGHMPGSAFDNSSGDAFITGLVRNVQDGSSQGTTWSEVSPADIAAQVVQGGDGQQPGCSQWPTPGGNYGQGGSDMVALEQHTQIHIPRGTGPAFHHHHSWGSRVWNLWRSSCSEPVPDWEDMTAEQLNHFMAKFVMEVKKVDGSPLSPNSIFTLCATVVASLEAKGIQHRGLLNSKDERFNGFRQALLARFEQLQAAGFTLSANNTRKVKTFKHALEKKLKNSQFAVKGECGTGTPN